MADRGAGRKRSREEYERGLYGYHDPTARIGGAAPTRSALTLRLWLAGFGLVFCTVSALLFFRADLVAAGAVLAILAIIAFIDLMWVAHRKRRGEPG